jgi:4-hydroxyphenylpyruvate dioxygenase
MTTAVPDAVSRTASSTDPLALIDVDHVRFWVGNAKQAAYFYASAFGFQVEQISDLTTGNRATAQYLLTQGNIRFVLESALTKDHPAAEEVRRYGDGIKDVAFTVFDAEAAWKQAVRNGGQSAYEPVTLSDASGSVTMAGVRTYGRAVHSFISRTGNYGLPQVKQGSTFMPGWRLMGPFALNEYNRQHPCGLKYVDHAVGNVEEGRMNQWVDWYEHVLGFTMFKHFDDKDISTEYSALMSKVMASGNQLIKWHDMTPGVQHLALRTDDELASVAELRRRGVDFLTIPDTYYEGVWARVDAMLRQHGHAAVKEDHQRIKDLGILVDADDEGYLLQLFSKPLQDRPTLFFEIICRRGSQSFGKGNFKALFESLEIEQGRRGNL